MSKDRLPEPRIETGPAIVHKVIISKGGRTYGHIFLYEKHVWKDGAFTGRKSGTIEDNWVHPDYRGQGYGRTLLRRAKKKARSVGLERVYLTARDTEERKAARKLYESEGFKQTTDGYTWEIPENQRKEAS